MKRFFTWGLALVLFAVAAVYLASVLWSPPAEGGPGDGAYPLLARPGVTHPDQPDPAAATPYDILPGVERRTDPGAPLPQGYGTTLALSVTEETGQGLAGSAVRLFRAGGGGKVAHQGHTNEQGLLVVKDLAAGTYLVEAEHDGFFPSAPRTVTVPSGHEEPEQIMLAPGALIAAHVQDEYGRPRVDGVVMIQQAQGAQRYVARADASGTATSPALIGGAWQVSWQEHQYADADSSYQTTLAAVPGDAVELWITLPAPAAAKQPAKDAPHYAVGVTLTAPAKR